MAKETSVIETGVDKLVDIVRAKKKISIQEAAKQLGVGPVVVEEWADFLEEEGVISIEYKFATPYLVEKKLTENEIKDKEKEYKSKKEGFVRKAEVALVMLDREGENFQKFKESFEKLKKDLGSDLVKVEGELKKLERFEALKNKIDRQISEQEKEFQKKIVAFENDINREQKRYQEIANNINLEGEKLDKQRLETLSLREREISINNKINQLLESIEKIQKAVKSGEIQIDGSTKKIKRLKKLAERIKKDLLDKDKAKELIEESHLQEQKILDLQHEIIGKVAKSKSAIEKKIEDGKTSTKKFKEFFEKKVEIEDLIKEMDNQKQGLEKELVEVIRKAKAFHLSSKSSGFKSHVKEIEKAFENIKKKKDTFEKEAIKLSSLLKPRK